MMNVTLVVLCYCFVSISLVFSNKVVMSSEGTSIPAPLFITWFQCVLTTVFVWMLGFIGKGKPKESFFAQFPSQRYELKVAKGILPLSLIFVGMVTFNNLCLKLVEVSFYNVARSLTICFNVFFTYFTLGEKTSFPTLVTLVVVIIGFVLGSEGEINFSLLGTVFGVLSSVFVSLNSIFTKKTLPQVESDEWRLAFYNNVNALLLFIPLIVIFGELKVLSDSTELLMSQQFWMVMTFAGVLGFFIGIITVIQIKLTSPLTHNMVGTAKSCLQTILALMIWQNPITMQGLAGLVMVILGSGLYTYVRSREGGAKKPPVILTPTPTPAITNLEHLTPSESNSIELVQTNLQGIKIDFEDGRNIKSDTESEESNGDNGFIKITLSGEEQPSRSRSRIIDISSTTHGSTFDKQKN